MLAFLANPNFMKARKEKVVECLHSLARNRDLKLYEQRPELKQVVRTMALDHALLKSLQPQTYVTTFLYSLMKMKVEEPEVWHSLAGYVAACYKQYDFRNLSNILYALHRVSQHKPVILNFDDLFTELEMPLVMQLDKGQGDP